MSKVRIQKILAAAGVASRRACEQLVEAGRVEVNGRIVDSLPCFVDPQTDKLRVDGEAVGEAPRRYTYFLLNKPRGVICTRSDPQGRRRAIDLVPPAGPGVHCVGRLDADSTGLIILTDDGELTQRLTHPRYGVPKTYVVEAAGRVQGKAIERLKQGVWLAGGRTQGAGVKVLRRGPERTLLQVTLREGRNREIRRTLAAVGHNVRKLKRVAIGPVGDRGLKVGGFRKLSTGEVEALRQAARTGPKPKARSRPEARSGRRGRSKN